MGNEDETARTMPLEGRTCVMDRVTQDELLWVDGVAVLPVGAVVQLGNPNRNATVTGIRLWAGPERATVFLDVDVEVVGP